MNNDLSDLTSLRQGRFLLKNSGLTFYLIASVFSASPVNAAFFLGQKQGRKMLKVNNF